MLKNPKVKRLSSLVVSLIGMIGITRICTPSAEIVFEEGQITFLTANDEISVCEEEFLCTLSELEISLSGKSDS